jgi:GT2 family glycosyltransferase
MDNKNIKFGAVAIGRNEVERLRQCLRSLSTAAPAVIIYVDSGSTDGSPQLARNRGAEVIEIDLSLPFTAARARNVGFQRLCELNPNLIYVQFVDGDCELIEGWTERAVAFLESHSDVAAVSGRRRERYPERSIYNWLAERGWDGPAGEVRACGGDAMMRVRAVAEVGGYRDDVLAGEEAELCIRLRAAGWHIWRLDSEMTLHDIAMTKFSQWWRRTVRAGHAFAQGAYLHGASAEHHRLWESSRAWIWGFLLPLVCLASGLAWGPWGWLVCLIYPLQVLRQMSRTPGSLRDRAVIAVFQMLSRFAEVWGQIRFFYDLVRGRQVRLIEYR